MTVHSFINNLNHMAWVIRTFNLFSTTVKISALVVTSRTSRTLHLLLTIFTPVVSIWNRCLRYRNVESLKLGRTLVPCFWYTCILNLWGRQFFYRRSWTWSRRDRLCNRSWWQFWQGSWTYRRLKLILGLGSRILVCYTSQNFLVRQPYLLLWKMKENAQLKNLFIWQT